MLNPTVVIGATSAIGAAICSTLRSRDPRVRLYLTGNSRVPSTPTLPDETWFRLDVTDAPRAKEIIEQVARETGNVFNVVYCAGVLADKPICNIEPSAWREAFAVNVEGALSVIQAAYRPLALGGKGRVVAITSVASQRPRAGQAAYASSKAALNLLIRTAAIELGRFGVTCNLVMPGAVAEGMLEGASEEMLARMREGTPLRVLSTSGDVASAVAFLLSDDAKQISGQSLVVDGGYLSA
jgi:NAD(P)-dependent dehydrogenase (short-subunit alcohol dehydrogenase family)